MHFTARAATTASFALWAALAGATPPGPAQPSAAATPDSGIERRIERIRIEERALVVDELRHGGETQSIVVTPREMPAYEIQPTDGARARPFSREGVDEARGARVWNLIRF